ncbi:MAG: hypothetical protein IPM69_06100 [Ignavibacteria bacterium]|nr:hypothetical protein [Ignavibacteria bacterium]
MKRLFLCAVMAMSVSMEMFAEDIDQLGVGVFVAGKAGTNIGTQLRTSESGFNINPLSDFGITSYIPLSWRKNYGVIAEVGMSSYSFSEKPITNATDDNTIIRKFNYLTIAPSFNAYFLTFGFAIGLPMGVSKKTASGTDLGTIENDSTFISPGVTGLVTRDLKDNTQMILEIRLGTMIPVLKSTTGRLNVFANLGYMISGMYKDEYYAKFASLSQYNPSTLSFSVGVNYVFNLTQPEADE